MNPFTRFWAKSLKKRQDHLAKWSITSLAFSRIFVQERDLEKEIQWQSVYAGFPGEPLSTLHSKCMGQNAQVVVFPPTPTKKQNKTPDRWKMGSAQLGENDEVRRKRLFWVSNPGRSGFYQHYGTAASSAFHEPSAESTQYSALQGKVWVET